MLRDPAAELIGTSPQIVDLKAEINRIASCDSKVLVTGESGTGKELAARAIHSGSLRKHRPFVAMNCAGLPDTLLESELFGHTKGSFTGAYRDKAGKFEIAHLGTVFLDEIGEMTLRMQGLLLRFLETGELQKVGADHVTNASADCRVVAATNRNLRDLIAEGQFREDLFYRINVIHLVVPPLRDRRADIAILGRHFLNLFATRSDSPVRSISPDAVAALSKYSWPGNVRELANVVERLVVSGRREVVTIDDLPVEVRAERDVTFRPRRERRRTIADQLYKKLIDDRESFWTAVYPLYMRREITKANVRDLIRRGLQETRGSYKIVVKLFNMDSNDYKKFLNFLRKHDCQLPFKEYR